jgi:hypothetical protein
MSLPKWKCHKIVEAAKIVALSGQPASGARPARLALWFEGDEVVDVDQKFIHKAPSNDPQSLVGGYYVRYEDGYESWSPAAAFEAGYTRLDG